MGFWVSSEAVEKKHLVARSSCGRIFVLVNEGVGFWDF
jgi:hypothetical protein